jgi:ribonucleotide reductase alpha subunit
MYTYEEAYKATKEYFNGNEFAAKVSIDKYQLKDDKGNFLEKTPEDIHKRLASEFARIEAKKFKKPLTEEEIFGFLNRYAYIIPQGSPIYGIGNKEQIISISNCFVIKSPEDSYGGILRADQELVQISKRRGGVGVDLSTLRPTNSPTKNSSKTSTGMSTWMERYSNSIREVGQHGRRGALMETLSIHHPDIETFISIKNDNTKVTGANISVRVTDEFLQALENNEDYEQRFPVDSSTPLISKRVKAKDIWKKIIHSAWNRAEPGVLFWDNIIKESPADCYPRYQSSSTNPCQPSWAKVLTKSGISTVGKIQVGDIIWSKEGWTTVTKIQCNGVKEVYKYTTNAGVFYGTDFHKVVTDKDGTKTEVINAETVEIITGPKLDQVYKLDAQTIMDGLVLGDGGIHKASNDLVGLYIGSNDNNYFTSEIASLIKEHRPGVSEEFYTIETNIIASELPNTYDRRIPERFINGDITTKLSLLRGLYSANGSVCGNRITLKSSSKGLIEDIQLLLSSIGIRSYYTINQAKKVKFNNGEYLCKESYDLNITTDREDFCKYIGFIQEYKNSKVKIVQSNRVQSVYKIISTEKVSEEAVFDFTVDNKTHTYWTNGVNVSNCGEIPLSPLDSCRLLVINLMCCVQNPYAKNAYFDYNEFYQIAQIAQRLMDDIVDLELECIDRILAKIEADPEKDEIKVIEKNLWTGIREACFNGRRTGLGLTALGDCLAALGIKYGSDRSIAEVDRIYKTLKFGSYRSSVDMAKELGPFPDWNWELEKDNPFINRIKDEEIYLGPPEQVFDRVETQFEFGFQLFEDIKKYGRRNLANLTNAPTGTISTQAQYIILSKWYEGVTSGIEPAYKLDFWRRKKGNPGDKDFRVDFVDQNGDSWMEFKIYHQGVQAWMDVTGNTEITDDCPYKGATAEEIDWEQRVELQAAAQRHIDHSISSTINLPNSATEEDVSKIYNRAWKAKLKGVTVYRDGCRTGVLITKEPEKAVIEEDRPKELPCDVYHLTSKGQQYFVLIGLFQGKPYEIFAGKNGFLDKGVKSGRIIRKARRTYKAVFDDADTTELCPITQSCSDHEETITRLTSALLRSGAAIHLIVEQLEKVHGDMTSFAKIVARALKKYIKDGTKVAGEACPECKETNIVRAEGCKKCVSCGWTACL